jgi:hypothetical protein
VDKKKNNSPPISRKDTKKIHKIISENSPALLNMNAVSLFHRVPAPWNMNAVSLFHRVPAP